MSKKFKITIADAEWEDLGSDIHVLKIFGLDNSEVVKIGGGLWCGMPSKRKCKTFKALAAAKAYVIRELSKSEKSK